MISKRQSYQRFSSKTSTLVGGIFWVKVHFGPKIPILIFLRFFKDKVKNSSPIPAKSAEIIVLSLILWPHGTLHRIHYFPLLSTTFHYFPAETQHAVQNRPWVPHAGGQDDGSLTQTPSNQDSQATSEQKHAYQAGPNKLVPFVPLSSGFFLCIRSTETHASVALGIALGPYVDA